MTWQAEHADTGQWATENDWNVAKPIIKCLYLQEAGTLRETMLFMEDNHNFKATIKMCKTRFKLWSFNKNNTEDNVIAVVREASRRARAGKKSAFKLGGRPVNLQRVHTYLRRKGLPIEELMSRRSPRLRKLSTLESFTPVDGPSSPITPCVHRNVELVLLSIRNYVDGSFTAGTWYLSESQADCFSVKSGNDMTALKSLYSYHDVACKLLDQGDRKQAGKVLIQAAANLKNILAAEHPRTLGSVFDLLIFLHSKHRPEIASIVLKQLAALSSIVFPGVHALRVILQQLATIGNDELNHFILLAWESAIDQFEKKLGAFQYSTLRSRLEYVQMSGVIRGFESVEIVLKNLVHGCAAQCGVRDIRYLKLLETLGDVLMEEMKYDEALNLAQDIVKLAPLIQPVSKAVDLSCAAYFNIARVAHGLSDNIKAEIYLRQAISINTSYWGWKHPLTLKYLVFLEEWSGIAGQVTVAAQAKQNQVKILDSMDDLI